MSVLWQLFLPIRVWMIFEKNKLYLFFKYFRHRLILFRSLQHYGCFCSFGLGLVEPNYWPSIHLSHLNSLIPCYVFVFFSSSRCVAVQTWIPDAISQSLQSRDYHVDDAELKYITAARLREYTRGTVMSLTKHSIWMFRNFLSHYFSWLCYDLSFLESCFRPALQKLRAA